MASDRCQRHRLRRKAVTSSSLRRRIAVLSRWCAGIRRSWITVVICTSSLREIVVPWLLVTRLHSLMGNCPFPSYQEHLPACAC